MHSAESGKLYLLYLSTHILGCSLVFSLHPVSIYSVFLLPCPHLLLNFTPTTFSSSLVQGNDHTPRKNNNWGLYSHAPPSDWCPQVWNSITLQKNTWINPFTLCWRITKAPDHFRD